MEHRRARAETVEEFAAALRELRRSVGNPSFREMSGRSGAISHTTLHEATKGNRLPSWETTVEFVKACGADPAEYRERWERASLPVNATRGWDTAGRPGESGVGAELPAVSMAFEPPAPRMADAPTGEAATAAPSTESVPAAPEEISGDVRRRGRALPIVALLATAAVCAGITIALRGGSTPAAVTPPAPSQTPTGPRVAGDVSQFLGDITIPDGTVVRPGERFRKVWEIRNAGRATWRGRYLARGLFPADNGSCETPAKVPIPDTGPGEKIRVGVWVTAPSEPGSCWVGWKMVDGEGNAFLPGARPVYFVVNVR
ncbi:hypothetical protein GCM10027589_20320 [Actinocorallia lasiicapitis]